jgi:putative heme-binding domain-containing protein
MHFRHRLTVALIAPFALGLSLLAEDEFDLGVRTTPPLSTAEQQAKFKLPPGFEMQLVAAEPDINKPMNLQFDALGRLWVTTSVEYPFPAKDRPGRDRLMIFEDFGPDGRARKVTQFADGLNIPIGVYPFRTDDKHWKAIVWSIPNIWLLEDTDGDGKADKKTPYYGPFDVTRDTHGNQASFRRGFDGWLYATHGFNNDSHVTAPDGSHVDLNSGNTYRMRMDGSHIEQHTHGQVNPFGLAWDARGNLYSSDCHSAPIYQLLEGGWYPSFGKPHDGLGFAPTLMEHAHGSTAIDGAFYYNDDLWPAEYQDNFFLGNVMTSRINRDHFVFHGSSPQAVEQPDFISTTDPWFRPVDNQLGPDGAMYIADFYNRIIGHYEVPLTHPGRDHDHGRIWRVVYKGTDGKAKLRPTALPGALPGLLTELASPNLTRRLLAQHEIEDRFGAKAVADLRKVARGGGSGNHDAKVRAQVHALWALLNLNQLDEQSLKSVWNPQESLLRIHGLRMLAEWNRRLANRIPGTPPIPGAEALRQQTVQRLADPDALVQRCAAEALDARPDFANLRPLLDLRAKVPAQDTHLLYVVRKAIRDHLNEAAIFQQVVAKTDWSDADRTALTDVAAAVTSAPAATFLLGEIERAKSGDANADMLKHIARYAPETELPRLAALVRARFATQPDFQLVLFKSVDQGLRQRGIALPAALQAWGAELAGKLLSADATAAAGWANTPLEAAPTENPWDFQERSRADGQKFTVLSSIVRGEPLTGTLRSPEFAAGGSFSFWLCGHDGYPDKPVQKKNVVRLHEAQTDAVLFEAWPPRNDVAQKVTWDTGTVAGKRVYLEATDADTGAAYAWIALGGFEGGLTMPTVSPRGLAERAAGAADLAARLGLKDVAPRLREVALRRGDPEVRATAAKSFAALAPDQATAAFAPVLADGSQPIVVRERIGTTLAELNSEPARTAVIAAMKAAPNRLQARWATALTGSKEGAEALLAATEQGAASPRLLQSVGMKNRLQAVKPNDWEARLTKLTKDLPPGDEARDRLIADRRTAYASANGSAADGERVFTQNCAVCHQLNGKGGLVGPQLTGIGNRGPERLCEDILDPNRNVDRAFRQTIVTLKDGDVVSGLFRREDGDLLVFADATGKEFSVKKADVTERKESEQSLMPENFSETIPPAQFNQLLAFLLSQRSGK